MDAPRQEYRFHQLQQAGATGWWRGVLGVLLLVACVIALAPALLGLIFGVGLLVSGVRLADVGGELDAILDLGDPSALGLAFVFLVLASAIPVTWALTRFLHGLPPGSLASVLPRIRWRYLAACFGLSVLAMTVTVGVMALVPASGPGTEFGTTLNEWTPAMRDMILVALLLTPLQAAGEEYAFRGYLTQVFGRFGVVPAVLVPALIFALAHGVQSAPVFIDRLAFGLTAGVLVIVTGGLEAAIAMHVLNNYLAFGLALAVGDLAEALAPSGGTWWSLPVTLTQSLTYLALAWWAARAMRIADRAVRVPAPRGVELVAVARRV
ncbi:CPBP family intramembrane glutamic endopeptidase [Nocardioides limicola]|uniref:CPBP family intramembrane glutamic endopeptidase n=1 Tax=Nocardioides limicola TaxID=2803368 RepID=UPI00193C03E9|nr:type II CAAX endopeptidase family protein [Nocardioides sp. DJM-14]